MNQTQSMIQRISTYSGLLVLLATFLVASCAPSQRTARSGGTPGFGPDRQSELSEIVMKMPAADETEREWMHAALVGMGPGAIHTLAGMLNAPGTGDDTGVRYALNGMAKYVSGPGRGIQQRRFENAVIAELQNDHPDAVLGFLMEQLELTGSDAAVPVLESRLGDETLNESAAHALRSINSEQAVRALLRGVERTQGGMRAALIKTLGDMQASSPAVVEHVAPFARSNDRETREAALYALSAGGNPDAETTLAGSGAPGPYLRYAARLIEEGFAQQAARISREVLAGDHPASVRIAALTVLVDSEGAQALDTVLEEARSPDPELRSAALHLAGDMPGGQVTAALVAELERSGPGLCPGIIATLGRRGDGAAWPAVRPYLQDATPECRLAAIEAAPALGGDDAMPTLLEALNHAKQPEEIGALKSALLRLPTEPVLHQAALRLASSPATAQQVFIEILAARRGSQYLENVLDEHDNTNGDVRLAVYRSLPALATPYDIETLIAFLPETVIEQEKTLLQEAIAQVSMDTVDPARRAEAVLHALTEEPDSRIPGLLEILPMIGGEKALEAVVAAAGSGDAAIRLAAFEALADWPDVSARNPLLQAYQDAPAAERPPLLERYIRLVTGSKYAAGDKVRFLSDALAVASQPRDKTAILGALSDIPSAPALREVAAHFNNGDPVVSEEAQRAAARILAPSYEFSSGFDGADQVLAVLESTADAETKERIEHYIMEFKSQRQAAEGFTPLFNGRDLTGWTGDTDAYTVRSGELIHQAGGSGNLFTVEQYGDFILRFQFKLTPGANNGLAIRSPLEGDPAYTAMELQILDNKAEQYDDLHPYQYHGSIYGVVPAERGHLKPAGEWNSQEVTANGSQITVKLNGVTILDTDLEDATASGTADGREHPGLLRSEGHIGFLGHGDEVAFRNIRIRDLNVFYPDYSSGSEGGGGLNRPPEGFVALFNGETLDGWKGLVGNPETRASMSDEELAEAQEKADIQMEEHWSVRDGLLYFDGEGESLTTVRDYKDFEMLVDWKIEPGGDSGIYLRGTPQVQIWDITENPVGSGGLYNNQEHRADPLVPADRPVGEWNRMRIKMIGERVTVHLNNRPVVPGVVMENYWDRDKAIYPSGQIELQAHNTPLYFRNIFIREIPRTEALFNGEDLSGWKPVGGNGRAWQAGNGLLFTEGGGDEWEQGTGGGWLSTEETYDNFSLELEYRLPDGGNSGVFLRAPREGDPAYQGIEIQLLDDYAEQYAGLDPWQYTGSIYGVKAPSRRVTRPAGEWQRMTIVADGPDLQVTLNGQMIINTSLVNHMRRVGEHPGLKRRNGYIGLQNHNSRVEFRNITITEIE